MTTHIGVSQFYDAVSCSEVPGRGCGAGSAGWFHSVLLPWLDVEKLVLGLRLLLFPLTSSRCSALTLPFAQKSSFSLAIALVYFREDVFIGMGKTIIIIEKTIWGYVKIVRFEKTTIRFLSVRFPKNSPVCTGPRKPTKGCPKNSRLSSQWTKSLTLGLSKLRSIPFPPRPFAFLTVAKRESSEKCQGKDTLGSTRTYHAASRPQ